MIYYIWKVKRGKNFFLTFSRKYVIIIMKVKENTKPERIYTMSKSKAELETIMRKEIIEVIRAALSEHFDLDPVKQIEDVSASEITVPLVDIEGNEKYPIIKVSIPRGKRNGTGGYIPYDGHAAAEEYKAEQEEKTAKKAASAAKKERAAKLREQKREAKQVARAVENLEKAVQDYNEKKGE